MRGPYLVTALPDDLSGLTTELAASLHRAAMIHGQPIGTHHKILMVKTPQLVCVLVTTAPDQMQVAVTRLPGTIVPDQAIMIYLTADSWNYMILETGIDLSELFAIGAELGADDP